MNVHELMMPGPQKEGTPTRTRTRTRSWGRGKGCTELQGRYLVMFKDHQIQEKTDIEPLEPEDKEILQSLAKQYLEHQFKAN